MNWHFSQGSDLKLLSQSSTAEHPQASHPWDSVTGE